MTAYDSPKKVHEALCPCTTRCHTAIVLCIVPTESRLRTARINIHCRLQRCTISRNASHDEASLVAVSQPAAFAASIIRAIAPGRLPTRLYVIFDFEVVYAPYPEMVANL